MRLLTRVPPAAEAHARLCLTTPFDCRTLWHHPETRPSGIIHGFLIGGTDDRLPIHEVLSRHKQVSMESTSSFAVALRRVQDVVFDVIVVCAVGPRPQLLGRLRKLRQKTAGIPVILVAERQYWDHLSDSGIASIDYLCEADSFDEALLFRSLGNRPHWWRGEGQSK